MAVGERGSDLIGSSRPMRATEKTHFSVQRIEFLLTLRADSRSQGWLQSLPLRASLLSVWRRIAISFTANHSEPEDA